MIRGYFLAAGTARRPYVNALVEFDGDNTYRGHTEIGGIVVTSTLHPFGQSTTPTLVKNGTELRLGGSLANALTPAGDLKLSLADGVSATMSGDVSTVPDSALLVDAGLGANLTITGKIGPADQASITMTGHGTLVLSNPDRQNRFGIIRDSIGTVRDRKSVV